MESRIADVTKRLCKELGIRGLINVQYIIYEGKLYVIEANPRASRTVPIIAKLTGVPLVAAATRIALGATLKEMGLDRDCCPTRLRRGQDAGVLVLQAAPRRDHARDRR